MSIFCCMAVSLYSVNLMYETQQPSYDIRDQFAHKKTSYNAKDTSKLFGSHQIYEWWLPEIIFFSPGTVRAITCNNNKMQNAENILLFISRLGSIVKKRLILHFFQYFTFFSNNLSK